MPNYCTNYITIEGDAESLQKFRKTIVNGELKFQQTVPRPATEDDNWYDWNNEHWGTKWDVGARVTDNGNHLSICIDTAWGPPHSWAETASKNYNVSIKVEYREPGLKFHGIIYATPTSYTHRVKTLPFRGE